MDYLDHRGLMDYLDVIRSESARFAQAARSLDLAASRSAPDWSGADLLYHLAEVQDFWSQMVLGATDTTSTTLARPAVVDDLLSVFEASSARLVAALESADPGGASWAWHEDHQSVAFVLRRQAQEALIHCVDAEQTAGWT